MVAFLFDLGQGLARFGEFIDFEFDDVDFFVEENCHVEATLAGGFFGVDGETKGGEIAVNNGAVVAFISCHVVFPIPVVGNGGKKGME